MYFLLLITHIVCWKFHHLKAQSNMKNEDFDLALQ